MKRLLQALAAVLACAAAGGIVWYEWQQLNRDVPPPRSSNVHPANVAPSDAAANATAVTKVARPNQILFKHIIAKKVDDLVHSAPYQEPEAVAANELTLPRAALPLLVEQSNRKDLSPPTIKAIKDALDADKPRVILAMKEKKRLDWYYNNTLAVFDKLNADKLPGRQPARSAIGAAVRDWARDPGISGDEGLNIWRLAYDARDAGSNDGLLFFVQAENLDDFGADKQRVVKTALQAEQSMEGGQYPEYFQLATALYAAQCIAKYKQKSDADQKEIARLVDRCKELYPEVIADPQLPELALLELFNRIGNASKAIYHDRRQLAGPMFEILQKSNVDPSVILTVQGEFNVLYAWDARGNGWGDTVTQQEWQLFGQRLTRADAALEKAWNLDHSNVYAATEMIQVELAQGRGKERMEMWFDRAVAADPLHYQAYSGKLNYLEPKWHGSVEEMLSFARQASKSAPPDSRVRLLIVEAQMSASRYGSSDRPQQMSSAYFRGDSQAWTDIHDAYMDYLPLHPESRHSRLQYARLAGWCEHWDEANRIFKELPAESFDPNVFKTQEDQVKFAARAAAETLHPSTMP